MMINEPIKITSLETLQREKQRLQMFCAFQEDLLKDKIISIKLNYKRIIGEELLPFGDEKNTKVSNILDWVNEFIFGKLLKLDIDGKNKLSGSFVKIVEVLIIRLLSKFEKR